ncbi:MAG: RsmE family RNA methyltransferase [Rickettsiales bacterium]
MRKSARVRLFVSEIPDKGGRLTVEDDAFFYLCRVMRLGEGDSVHIFNDESGEWRGELGTPQKREVSVCVAERIRPPEKRPSLTLVFSPLKNKEENFLLQKATELGVGRLLPCRFSRTVARDVKRDHAQKIVVEAAEQCERVSVPLIDETRHFTDVAEALAGEDGLLCLHCDEQGEGKPAREALSSLPPHDKAALIVGPEGGFTDEERASLKTIFGEKLARLCLGPRILKAETAAMAALVCYQTFCGDWNALPRYRD